ncbi:flagellar hook protein FlgE [Sandaracinobacter sp. RS1-74]|uniref:flagellar hook protein FlgE n=1 Tax=Sandaracinobacteroides sayramensis TaxID=2913411 RepID=UPI001EDA1899|nr:flagellar hook protein FlgE [Sandaracinobacteroides sayramensis]MCG2840078.1 flagellar hook protein FlgE [Sandaracinobacteroides sayramensis]
MTFFISLTGLNAAQTELSALSNNIANVGTSGFKKSRVEFGDIVTRSAAQAANRANGAGVTVAAVKQQFTQGGYQNSSNALDLSIAGQGFFLVKGGGDRADSLALSRNGAFSVDENRWVIDNEGRRLQILPTTADGAVTGLGASALQALRLPISSGEPRATTSVRFTANLPAAAAAPTAPFDRGNPASYNGATSTPVFAADGSAQTATLYYRRLESPPGDTNKYWEIRSFLGDSEIGPIPGPGPQQLTFDSNGVLTTPTGPVAFSGGFSISHADSTTLNEPFSVPAPEQDGYAPGRLEGVGVDQAGIVRASFSNGETFAIGKLAIGNVANPQGLKQNGNVSWTLSPTSGPLQVGEAAQDGFGNIASGSLERSNVDLTEELVGLISAQRNFQANARAIDTASTLLQTIIQLRG